MAGFRGVAWGEANKRVPTLVLFWVLSLVCSAVSPVIRVLPTSSSLVSVLGSSSDTVVGSAASGRSTSESSLGRSSVMVSSSSVPGYSTAATFAISGVSVVGPSFWGSLYGFLCAVPCFVLCIGRVCLGFGGPRFFFAWSAPRVDIETAVDVAGVDVASVPP